jgi:hypothetical protein
MTDSYLVLGLALAAGVGAAFLIVWSRWKPGARIPGVGLLCAYTMNLGMLHFPGAAVHLLPWYRAGNPGAVEDGLVVTAYGVVSLAAGSIILGPFVTRVFGFPRVTGPRHVPEGLLPRMYIAAGVGFYVVARTATRGIPTLSAVLASGWNLVVVGLGLACLAAWQQGRKFHFLVWLTLAAMLPGVTTVIQGFLGYGVSALLVVLALVLTFTRFKLVWLPLAALGMYVALSGYVTYMRDRSEIREGAWHGAPIEERLAQLADTLSQPEWFDPYDQPHLQRVEQRMNQNYLIGAAVSYLEVQNNPFARGETLWDAVLALIPRALWPGKSVEAGSGDLVTRYTGITFGAGTSVGIGQVMEFYINFGRLGVVVGFLVLGVVLALVDLGAYQRLVSGDWQGCAVWYLPGISLMQAGGSLVEVTSSAAAAVVVALLVNRFLLPDLRGRPVLLAHEEVGQQLG